MFQLLVSTTFKPLFATDGSFTVDCEPPELIKLVLKTVKVLFACLPVTSVGVPRGRTTSAAVVCGPSAGARCIDLAAINCSRAAISAAVGAYATALDGTSMTLPGPMLPASALLLTVSFGGPPAWACCAAVRQRNDMTHANTYFFIIYPPKNLLFLRLC